MQPARHVPTGSAQCDTCHKSTAAGGFSSFIMGSTGHAALSVTASSNCTTCHASNYLGVVTKPATHVSTTANCTTCHSGFSTFTGVAFNHGGVAAGTCNTCHLNGTNGAMVQPARHVPTGSVQCDTCHKSTAAGGFSSFVMGSTGHSALSVTSSSNCTTCHAASYLGIVTKPAGHVSTTANCTTCHSGFSTFSRATFNHSGVTAGTCNTCHLKGANGAMVQTARHVPTGSVQCDTCHKSTVAGGFSSFVMGSTGHAALSVTASSNCTTCHASNYLGVVTKPAGHVSTTQNRTTCHSGFATFTGVAFNHSGVAAGTCNTCHLNGANGAMMQPAKHVPTGLAQCDTCHKSTAAGGFSSFTMGSTGHSALSVTSSSNCKTCHASNYLGVVTKPAGHVSTTQNCTTCHSGFTSFAGVTFNHSGVAAGTCNTCHLNGTNGAMMQPAKHVPTGSVQCDTCHKSTAAGGFSSFVMGSTGHSALSVTASSNCTTCHAANYLGVVTKPAGHVSTTQNCTTCHGGFATFAGGVFNHGGVAAGTCASCHLNGTNGAMKEPARHVPTGSVSCDTCHKSTAVGGFSSFVMGSTGHSALNVTSSSTCTTCHASNYLGVVTKPTGHVATSQNCTSCHSGFTTFAGVTFNHSGVAAGTCSSCHLNGANGAMTEPARHVPTGSAQCDMCHKSTAVGGFSSFVMGSTGHSALNVSSGSNCTACHAANYLGVVAKPTGHVSTSQNCSVCHSGFATFASASFNHSGVTVGTCASCHLNGTNGAMKEPARHMPTGSVSCDTCHKSAAVGGFASFVMGNSGHSALSVTLSSNCMTCHGGSYLGTATFRAHSGRHGATASNANYCGNCHKSFTRSPGD
jgi:hypothetical protein